MLNIERPEFDKQLAILCAGLDVPCTDERKEAYWKGLNRMSLPLFTRAVEQILSEENWTKVPKPGQIWEASRRLRAQVVTPPKDDGPQLDPWERAANHHLLAHIVRRTHAAPKCYGEGALAMRATQFELDALGLDRHALDASPNFLANVESLKEAKRAWAAFMRAATGPTPELQQATWIELMADAERMIAQRMRA